MGAAMSIGRILIKPFAWPAILGLLVWVIIAYVFKLFEDKEKKHALIWGIAGIITSLLYMFLGYVEKGFQAMFWISFIVIFIPSTILTLTSI